MLVSSERTIELWASSAYTFASVDPGRSSRQLGARACSRLVFSLVGAAAVRVPSARREERSPALMLTIVLGVE